MKKIIGYIILSFLFLSFFCFLLYTFGQKPVLIGFCIFVLFFLLLILALYLIRGIK